MHCIECGFAVYPADICEHPKVHDIPIANPEKVKAALAEFSLASPSEVNARIPNPRGPPVEGLEISDGFKCSVCNHAATSRRGVENVYLIHHPELPMKPEGRAISTKVQRFWKVIHRVYFAVEPILETIPAGSPFAVYMQHHYQTIPDTATSSINLEARNNHPLVRMAGWHTHLDPYIGCAKTRGEMVNLATFPKSAETTLSKLHDHVCAYVKSGAVIGREAAYFIRRMLHHYPPYVAQLGHA